MRIKKFIYKVIIDHATVYKINSYILYTFISPTQMLNVVSLQIMLALRDFYYGALVF